MAFDHSKFLARFVDEAREHCSRLSDGLLALETSSGDAETVNALFRSAHTIKGSARMMKLTGVSELAHAMEDVLDAARGGRLDVAGPVSDLLFKGLDALSAMLDAVAAGEKPEAPADLRAELARAATGETADARSQAGPDGADAGGLEDGPAEPAADAQFESVESGSPAGSGTSIRSDAGSGEPAELPPSDEAAKPSGGRQAEYLRINSAKLDDLIRLMGEIVSEQGRLRKDVQRLIQQGRVVGRELTSLAGLLRSPDAAAKDLESAAATASALGLSLKQAMRDAGDSVTMQDHLVGELQDASLKLRMMPLSTVFEPLRRTVRDLSREYGKEIDFVIDGGETELDRKITERIGDSLLHMIRNSLDHGLESSDERLAVGKPRKGAIALSAFNESGGVTIALRDDGRGLSTEKIREKALAKRLHDADALSRMSRAEINNLIFLPGFSTSPIITDISGRGVGMDVVRKNIVDELKGAVFIETSEGRGTSFLLRLPLNLAVFPLFLLGAGDTVCALPSSAVAETLSVSPEEIIEIVDKRAIRLREQIVPLEDLGAILGLTQESPTGRNLVVVVRDGEGTLALRVDEIIGREEMVVKPLPSHLKNLRLVMGGTVGDGGRIVPVLSVPEVMRLSRDLATAGRAGAPATQERAGHLLVVDDSINTREIEKSILEAYGYVVDTAEDGQEAFEKTRGEMYDLIVTDVEMPRLDGFSLTERLRADQRYRDVPVIIVTSLEKEADKKRGVAVGADAYIVKRAFDQSNLLDTVKSLIG